MNKHAILAAEVKLPAPPEGALARIKNSFEKMRLLSALRARPKVSEASERDGGRIQLYFSPFIYREEADSLRDVLPPGAKLSYYLNPAMEGLWVELDVSGVKDAQGAAREFARRYPEHVAKADIRVKVEVMRMETR